MEILGVCVFGVVGVLLDQSLGHQSEWSKTNKKVSWSAKLLDALLIMIVLLGLIVSLLSFPLGLVGLFIGAIFAWAMFD